MVADALRTVFATPVAALVVAGACPVDWIFEDCCAEQADNAAIHALCAFPFASGTAGVADDVAIWVDAGALSCVACVV